LPESPPRVRELLELELCAELLGVLGRCVGCADRLGALGCEVCVRGCEVCVRGCERVVGVLTEPCARGAGAER
jgi:hypothetical protein